MIQHNQLNLIQTSSVFPPSLSAPGSNPGNYTVLSCHVCLASSDLWQLLRPLLTHVKTTQLSSVAQSCPTLCDPMNRSTWGLPAHHQVPESTQHARPPCPSPSPGVHAARKASLPITKSRNPPKPMSIEPVMPPNHLTLCRPLLLLPSIFPSIRVFSNESALGIRWSKY